VAKCPHSDRNKNSFKHFDFKNTNDGCSKTERNASNFIIREKISCIKINLFLNTTRFDGDTEELLPQYIYKEKAHEPLGAKLEKLKEVHNRLFYESDIRHIAYRQGRNTIALDKSNKSSSSLNLLRKRCTHSHVKENSIDQIDETSRILYSKQPHPSKLISKKPHSMANTKDIVYTVK
jgi:hypothetical protein